MKYVPSVKALYAIVLMRCSITEMGKFKGKQMKALLYP